MLYNFIHKNKPKEKEGFTLIEVIVSLSLFTIVMVIALGALFMVIAANRQAKAIKLVVNNVNLAMEGMTRDLRVGYEYCTTPSGSSCDSSSTGVTQIYFTTDKGEANSSYRLSGGTIERRIGSSAQYFEITGSDVVIDEMKFYIQGTETGDNIQPFVTVVIRGTIQVAEIMDDFHLQSTISQRKLAP